MTQFIRVLCCLFAGAFGVAPPAVLPPPVQPAALPAQAVVAQVQGTNVGNIIANAPASMTPFASTAPLVSRLRGQQFMTSSQVTSAEGSLFESLQGSGSITGAQFDRQQSSQPSDAAAASVTDYARLLGVFALSAVAAAAAAGSHWSRRRAQAACKKASMTEMTTSSRMLWPEVERPSIAVASFAGKEVFDPIGHRNTRAKARSSDRETNAFATAFWVKRPAGRHLQASSIKHPRTGATSLRATGTEGAPLLRLGTRDSPLAVAQAHETKRRLGEAFPELAADDAVEIVEISTEADRRLEIPLSEIGDKGLFTKELDVALLNKEVDFCVHSTKDVPTWLVPGTDLVSILPREDTRDALICRDGSIKKVADLPTGSVIGTASLRRRAQILAINPGVKCVNFRGNVQTRLKKLNAGEVDATLLALAGLKRMSMESNATAVLEWEEMLPAVAQGAISLQCRTDDEQTVRYLQRLNHEPTAQAVICERAFLATLDGNCRTPIAGQARVENGRLLFEGLLAAIDGQRLFRVSREGAPEDAETIGKEAGLEVRSKAGEKFLEEMQEEVAAEAAANTKPK